MATGLGGILGFDFVLGIILLSIWLMTVGMWKYSSGGALMAFILFPVIVWAMGQKIEFLIFSILISGIIISKHKQNIKRLMDGTESRIEF